MNKAGVLLACALLASGAARAAAPLRVTMIDAGFPKILLAYAEHRGLFSSAGLAVEPLPSSRFILPPVLAGRADLAVISLAPVLEAYQHGADVKVLAVLYPRFEHYAVSRYAPADAAKIKTVAYNSHGAASRLVMEPFFDHLKLDGEKTASVAAAGDAARYAMLERGAADLTTLSSPELRARIAAEKKFFLLPPGAGGKGDPVVLAASGRALEERGPEIERFVSALRAALKRSAENGEETRAYLLREEKFSPEAAALFAAELSRAARSVDFVPSTGTVQGVMASMKARAPKRLKSFDDLLFPDYAAAAARKASPAAR